MSICKKCSKPYFHETNNTIIENRKNKLKK